MDQCLFEKAALYDKWVARDELSAGGWSVTVDCFGHEPPPDHRRSAALANNPLT